jgi:ubiquitin carboxyl-terminal hydrolase 8
LKNFAAKLDPLAFQIQERIKIHDLLWKKIRKKGGKIMGSVHIARSIHDIPSCSSTIQRFHSYYSYYPEQMRDDRELNVEHATSHYDPSNKPLQKPRPSEIIGGHYINFSPVLGNMGHGITGLKNLGNSCYMSSIIQCINNTGPLIMYFCNGIYLEDVNRDNNSTRGEVANEVAAVINKLWSGQCRSIEYTDLKNAVAKRIKQFQGCKQQDSHEFHIILMDLLHEDLKRNSRKPPLRETNNDNMWPVHHAWENFQWCNQSIIQSLFYGQQKSTVRCCKCGEKSVTYEAFSDLSLPLPSSSNKCSLAECIKLYLSGEKISGWNCPSCKDEGDAIKKFDIWKLPAILVIHLNRFYYDGSWRKRQTYVDFPFDMAMQHFSLFSDQQYVNYKLYAVSNHYGSMEGGHYTAYCKNALYKKWYEFDDHEVSEISNTDVCSEAAYVLFYTSVECDISLNNS